MKNMLLSATALLALAACNSNGGNASAPSAPVAAVKAPAGTEWTTTVTETPDGGYLMGNPNAAIKLIEYGSRTCPHCGKFAAESAGKLQAYVATGKVSYEFRDFPIHSPDVAAILLGRCAGPKPYFDILEQTFAAQAQVLPKLEQLPADLQAKIQGTNDSNLAAVIWADYLGYGEFMQQRGVTADQVKACLADKATVQKMDGWIKNADKQYQITGTPTFILNGNVLPNVNEWPGVEAALKAAGA